MCLILSFNQMSEKVNTVGVMKPNFTKHVYFSFNHGANSLSKQTYGLGELAFGGNERNSAN